MADEDVVVVASFSVPSSDMKRKHDDLEQDVEEQRIAQAEVSHVTITDDKDTVTKRMKFDLIQEAAGNGDDISEGEYRPDEDKMLDSETNEAESKAKELDFDNNGSGSEDNSGIDEMGNECTSSINEEENGTNVDKNDLGNKYGSGVNELARDSETIEVGNDVNSVIIEVGKGKTGLELQENHPENIVLETSTTNSDSKDADQFSIPEPENTSVGKDLENVQTGNDKETPDDLEIPNEQVKSLDETKASCLENEVQIVNEKVSTSNVEISNEEVHSLDDTKVSSLEEEITADDDVVTSRKIEIPNDKVGVLIGKGGDTIRFIQSNADAKIQIMRDAEADLHSVNRPVEIVGKLSCIIKAKKLIDAVIAEANAGGSPSLVARGLSSGQSSGQGEQVEMHVPNDKVGLIIGRRGENIKSLQARSGARIQLIPQHQPEGDGSKDRIVRLSGDRRQVKTAREMIQDVMNQQVRGSSGQYNHPAYGSSSHGGPPYWGPRGPPHQPMPYDYPPRPSHYSNYPMPQVPARMPAWDQRPFSHAATFDSYNARAHPPPGPYMGPPNQAHYYQQSHPSEYSHHTPYPSNPYPTNQPYPTQQYPKQPSYQQPYGQPQPDAAYSIPQQYSYAQSYPQPTAGDGYSQGATAYPQSTGMAGFGQPAASAYVQGATGVYGQYMYADQGGYQVTQEGSYVANTGVMFAQPASAQAASQPASAVYDHAAAAQQTATAQTQAQPAYAYDSAQSFAAPH